MAASHISNGTASQEFFQNSLIGVKYLFGRRKNNHQPRVTLRVRFYQWRMPPSNGGCHPLQSIQAKKQRKKGEPPSSQNKKVGKNKSLMKRPAAVMKRPAARVPTAGSSAAGPPSASGSWGCIRCRGNVNGCKACRKPGFSGRKFYSRGEWKEWAAANGKK